MLDEAKVKDSNASRYINQENDIQADNDHLRLNFDARVRAQRYVDEVLNQDTPEGWQPGDEKPRAQGTGQKNGKPGDTSAVIMQWVSHEATQRLIQSVPPETMKGLETLDRGLLALYGIGKSGNDDEIPVQSIAGYLYEAFEVDVPVGNLRKALTRTLNSKNEHVNCRDGCYRIAAAGRVYVEKKLLSKAVQP